MKREIISKIVKASGVSAGANYMFGGENKASDHVDFVGFGKIKILD